MVAAKLATMKHGGDRGANQHGERQGANLPDATTNSEAAKLLNVSERTVKTAKSVQEKGAPELIQAVEKGKVSVSAAAEIATKPKEEQQKIVELSKDEIVKQARKIERERKAEKKADVEISTSQADAAKLLNVGRETVNKAREPI